MLKYHFSVFVSTVFSSRRPHMLPQGSQHCLCQVSLWEPVKKLQILSEEKCKYTQNYNFRSLWFPWNTRLIIADPSLWHFPITYKVLSIVLTWISLPSFDNFPHESNYWPEIANYNLLLHNSYTYTFFKYSLK